MSPRHGFFDLVTGSYFLPESMSRSTLRLGLFVAASVLVHAFTIFGVDPFRFTGLNAGAGPARFELHATLAPAPAAAPQVEPGDASDSAASAEHATPATAPAARDSSLREEAGLALPSPDKWYTAREVDVRAEPLTAIPLRYPESLRGTLVGGKVRLRLFIDERGALRKMQVADAEPPGLFEEAAKRAWSDIRFTPALKDGVPVKSQKLIELTYVPD